MAELDILLQEYSQLREELRLHLKPQINYGLILTAITGAVAISTAIRDPLPCLLMAILPLFVLEEHTRRLNAMHRISTYIAIHIEPHFRELYWETDGMRFIQMSTPGSRIKRDLDLIVMLVLMLIQIVIAWFIWIDPRNSSIVVSRLSGLLHPFLSLIFSDRTDVIYWSEPLVLFSLTCILVAGWMVMANHRNESKVNRERTYVELWQKIREERAVGTGRDDG